MQIGAYIRKGAREESLPFADLGASESPQDDEMDPRVRELLRCVQMCSCTYAGPGCYM
jgi:hypothetical protein